MYVCVCVCVCMCVYLGIPFIWLNHLASVLKQVEEKKIPEFKLLDRDKKIILSCWCSNRSGTLGTNILGNTADS